VIDRNVKGVELVLERGIMTETENLGRRSRSTHFRGQEGAKGGRAAERQLFGHQGNAVLSVHRRGLKAVSAARQGILRRVRAKELATFARNP